MVRGLVAWAFFKVEGFEVWARVFDSRSKGSRFCRLGYTDPPWPYFFDFAFLPKTIDFAIQSFVKSSIS